jgi:hypothetical protein
MSRKPTQFGQDFVECITLQGSLYNSILNTFDRRMNSVAAGLINPRGASST